MRYIAVVDAPSDYDPDATAGALLTDTVVSAFARTRFVATLFRRTPGGFHGDRDDDPT